MCMLCHAVSCNSHSLQNSLFFSSSFLNQLIRFFVVITIFPYFWFFSTSFIHIIYIVVYSWYGSLLAAASFTCFILSFCFCCNDHVSFFLHYIQYSVYVVWWYIDIWSCSYMYDMMNCLFLCYCLFFYAPSTCCLFFFQFICSVFVVSISGLYFFWTKKKKNGFLLLLL